MAGGRSLLPRGLKLASTVSRLLGLRIPILPEHARLSLVPVVLSGLRRSYYSSRGVLPSVVCLIVFVKLR